MGKKKKIVLFVALIIAMSSYSQSLDCLNLLPNSRYSKNQALAKDSQVLFPCLEKTVTGKPDSMFIDTINTHHKMLRYATIPFTSKTTSAPLKTLDIHLSSMITCLNNIFIPINIM